MKVTYRNPFGEIQSVELSPEDSEKFLKMAESEWISMGASTAVSSVTLRLDTNASNAALFYPIGRPRLARRVKKPLGKTSDAPRNRAEKRADRFGRR